MPPKESKGVNREYVVRAYMGLALRIPLREFKLFEATLTPLQQKKAPFISLLDVYQKANQLLNHLGRQPFGFAPGILPEEKWMLGVLRFVDRPNLTGAFLTPLEVPQEFREMDFFLMKTSQKNASDWLSSGALASNSNFWNLKCNLWEAVRKLRGTDKDIESLEQALARLRERRAQEQQTVDSRKTSFAMAVYNLKYPGQANNDQGNYLQNEHARNLLRELVDA
jgi:hypothetical protein